MELQIYQTKRIRNGKLVTGRLWRGRLRLDGDSKPREIALKLTDEAAARKKLETIAKEIEQERNGDSAPKIQREAAQKPIADFLPDYAIFREQDGQSAGHIKRDESKLKRLAAECPWNTLREIKVDSFERWRSRQSNGPKTLNEYLNAARAFLRYLRRLRVIAENPLKEAVTLRLKGRQKKNTRALSTEQLWKLVDVSGERGVPYLAALHTGLRRGELDKWQWCEVDFDAPCVRLSASKTKNKEEAFIPMTPDLAQALRDYRPTDAQPDDLVFPRGVPDMDTFRKDLTAAGIEHVDAKGRPATFHGLRRTFGTQLQIYGALLCEAQKLMRHSDPKLTANVYFDPAQLALADAIAKLPSRLRNDTRRDTREAPFTPPDVYEVPLGCLDPNEWQPVEDDPDRYAAAVRLLQSGIMGMVRTVGFEPTAPAV